ncbi:MAG: hypothetical protein IPJ07_16960 [Acidobacteria bacterium]|nr:hypothetical protein [Acidobacteriota bacterium]
MMKINYFKRLVLASIIGAGMLLGTNGLANSQEQEQKQEKQQKKDEKKQQRSQG